MNILSLCVRACVLWRCPCICVRMHRKAGHTMLGGTIFFFFLKMRSLAGLELTKYTNLTGQEDQESAALGLQVCVTMPAFLTYRF